jgi:hypothetical protein
MPAGYDISHMLLLFDSDMIIEINLEKRWQDSAESGFPKLIIDK